MAAPAKPPQPRSSSVQLDTGLRRDVGKLSLLFTGVGSIIGSGWLFGALYAAQIAGPAAILSWVIGGVMFIIVGLAYSELGVMFPVAGGIVRFPNYSFGSFTAYSAGFISWLAAASVAPIEVLATAQYAAPYLPWLGSTQGDVFVLSTPYGLLAAIGLMFVYSLINVLGVKAFAQFNNVLVWWKLAVIVLVIAVFFAVAFNPGNLTNFGGFAPAGWGAVFAAIPAGGVAFAYLGYRQGIEFAGETDNPQRNVPFAVVGSLVITMIIYVALQVAFLTALPPDFLSANWGQLGTGQTADELGILAGPLAGTALLLGVAWLALLLRIDAVVSPADTGLIYAGVTARLSYANARNANAPQWLTRLNNRGVPWLSVVLMFVVGCFFFLPFPGWAQLVTFVVTANVLSFGTGPLVVAAMRRQLPDQDRPFKLGGGDIIPFLAFLSTNMIVLWAGWDTIWKIGVAVALGYVILAVYTAMEGDRMPPFEWKAGSWIIPWFLLLGIVSYLSKFGGGSAILSHGWSAVSMFGVTVVIYVWAILVRLPSDRAAENIQKTPVDAPGNA